MILDPRYWIMSFPRSDRVSVEWYPVSSIQYPVSSSVCHFLYICIMKALVIKPRNDGEYKFLADLLKKLGIGSSFLTAEDLEDIGMSKMMRDANKSKRVSRADVMKKLAS